MSRLVRALVAFTLVTLSALVSAGQPANAADTHALTSGSGSSWAAIAVQQWISDVSASGIKVVFTSTGSGQGRKDFALKTTDYGVTDIGYQGKDPVTGDVDDSGGRDFAYLPIVAGGTSFAYHVERAGQLVRNVRLSGLTLAKIFTNQITDWSDPAITKDNNGSALPSLPIIPVVHSEPSGSSAQFTRYMAKQYPDIWTPFNDGDDSLNEYYPRKGQAVALNGSDNVMNYVASNAANGAITYDEYSYALAKNFPVIKLENPAGYYTLPTQYNVAVALTQAVINNDPTSPDYLLQNLDNVYSYNDPRSYSMSSYSYMIIPTAADDKTMTTPKRQTLADYLFYGICPGQKEIGPIGYSSLPVNLVQAGFSQLAKLKTADPMVDLDQRDVSQCNNPTFDKTDPSKNYLAVIAPQPAACDKDGTGPCTATGAAAPVVPGAAASSAAGGKGGSTTGKTTGTKTTGTTGGTTGGTAAGTTGAATGGTATGGTATSGTTGDASATTGSSDPLAAGTATTGGTSGDLGTSDGSVATDGSGSAPVASALVSTRLPEGPASNVTSVLAPLAVVLFLALVLGPPWLFRRLRKTKAVGSS